jgi:hypothetical protein
MTNKTNNNRRQYYRYEPPANAAPLLSLVLGGHRCPAQQVIDVSLKGIRLAFSDSELPPLAAGTPITASIKAAGLRDAADIAGRVVLSFVRGSQRVVAIAFTDTPDLADRATADFFRIFNRREDLRRSAAPGRDTVSALVLNADGLADGVIDLELRDLSDKGIGFVVDSHTDAFMRDGAALALPLPDRQQAVFPAQVRRRNACDGGVHYGCTFDGTST